MTISLYGFAGSQPCRAVWWACLIKELPFHLRFMDRDYEVVRELNPVRQVPFIRDGDFILAEMPAILCYLSDKNGWEDLYPKDLKARALVNQYLHFHHSFSREATYRLMFPHVAAPFLDQGDNDPRLTERIAFARRPDMCTLGKQAVDTICELIEKAYFYNDTAYLCADHPTIADIACYQELAQLRWGNLYHFEGFPKIIAWLAKIEQLPHHDEAHSYNLSLGDISKANPNTLDRFIAAEKAAMESLAKLGISIEPV